MMKINLTKRVAAFFTSLTVILTTLFSFPVVAFANESSVLDEYNMILYEIGVGGEPIAYDNEEWVDVVIDSGFWGSIPWYDTYEDAATNARFKNNGISRAEYKKYWLFGWRTQNCRIKWTDIWKCDGKYTPIYQNDYDGKFHAGNRYM